jgi:3-methyl-2-oxobutanoate hydroxymethyltransferase
MLGVTSRVPKFCKTYANLGETIPKAIEAYVADVKARKFPEGGRHTYDMPDEERRRFAELSQDLPPLVENRR